MGASVYLARNAYAIIKSCTFKQNKACQFWWWDGTGYAAYFPSGSAISVGLESDGLLDSCIFKSNLNGKDYKDNSILTNASTVYVQGSKYYKKTAKITINNSIFDANEGVSLYTYSYASSTLNNCSFINTIKNKSLYCIHVFGDNCYVSSNNCYYYNNNCVSVIKVEEWSSIHNQSCLFYKNNCSISTEYKGYNIWFNSCKILNNSNTFINATSIQNCLITNNSGSVIIYLDGSITNSTIANNHGANKLLICDIWGTGMMNSIFWNNKSDSSKGRQMIISKTSGGGGTQFLNNIVQNDTANFALDYYGKQIIPLRYTENISTDPLFVNPTNGIGSTFDALNADFSVINNCNKFSPAINTGNNNPNFGGPIIDILGNSRPYEGRRDMGCYENYSGIPTISVLKQAKNDTLCEKSRNAELALSAIGKGLIYQWQQSTDSGNSWIDISGQTNVKLSLLTNPSQNTILFRAILNGTCDVDTGASAQIITNPLPVVNLGKDTAVCKNSIVDKSVATNGNYLWHTGKNTNGLSQKIAKDTMWWLQVTNQYGCKQRDTVKINSNPLPVVNLGPDQSIDRLQQITLDAGAGQSKYLWNDGSGLQTKTFLGKDLGAIGKYTLWAEVTNSFGCSSRDSIEITVTDNSSIHGITTKDLLLYPQPANDILNIEIPQSLVSENTSLSICTIEGKTILNRKLNSNLNQISIGHLEAGIYLVTVTDHSTKQTLTLKWVKG